MFKKKDGGRTEPMEDEILEKAAELRDLILGSDEYTKFQFYREHLMKEEDLYRKVNEFREKNFELQIRGDSANANLVEHLTQQYINILEKPVVNEYMQAELILCRKLQMMYRIITEKIELDLNFL